MRRYWLLGSIFLFSTTKERLATAASFVKDTPDYVSLYRNIKNKADRLEVFFFVKKRYIGWCSAGRSDTSYALQKEAWAKGAFYENKHTKIYCQRNRLIRYQNKKKTIYRLQQ